MPTGQEEATTENWIEFFIKKESKELSKEGTTKDRRRIEERIREKIRVEFVYQYINVVPALIRKRPVFISREEKGESVKELSKWVDEPYQPNAEEIERKFNEIHRRLNNEAANQKENNSELREELLKLNCSGLTAFLKKHFFSKEVFGVRKKARGILQDDNLNSSPEEAEPAEKIKRRKISSVLYGAGILLNIIVSFSMALMIGEGLILTLPLIVTSVICTGVFYTTYIMNHSVLLDILYKLLNRKLLKDLKEVPEAGLKKWIMIFGFIASVCANIIFFVFIFKSMVNVAGVVLDVMQLNFWPILPTIFGVMTSSITATFLTLLAFQSIFNLFRRDPYDEIESATNQGWNPENVTGIEKGLHRFLFILKSVAFLLYVLSLTIVSVYFIHRVQMTVFLGVLPVSLVWPGYFCGFASIIANLCFRFDCFSSTTLFVWGKCQNFIREIWEHPLEKVKVLGREIGGSFLFIYDSIATLFKIGFDASYWSGYYLKNWSQAGEIEGPNFAWKKMRADHYLDQFTPRKPLYWKVWFWCGYVLQGEGVLNSWDKMKTDEAKCEMKEYKESEVETYTKATFLAVLLNTASEYFLASPQTGTFALMSSVLAADGMNRRFQIEDRARAYDSVKKAEECKSALETGGKTFGVGLFSPASNNDMKRWFEEPIHSLSTFVCGCFAFFYEGSIPSTEETEGNRMIKNSNEMEYTACQ